MRASWFVVVGAVVSGLTACGGGDNGELFGSGGAAGASSGGSSAGGSSAGGSSAGGSSAGGSSAGGSSAGGNAGAPSGGAAGAGGTSSGGSGGNPGGGSGGSATGGSGGSATGGSGGSATGGSGGSATGGMGGTTGGTGGAATGGSGGGCTVKKWCKDSDNDGYGSPFNTVSSCYKPGTGSWIQEGSKPEACGDCADLVKEAFPFSNFCGATGYTANGSVSFDYNCDTYEIACADYLKASTCGFDATSGKCTGSGYLPVPGSTAQNKYCGSSQYQDCLPATVTLDAGGANLCTPSVKTVNHLTCK